MKKFLCCLVCMVFLPICSFAEVDLSTMSFDELTALQSDLEEEMRTRNVKLLDLKSLKTDELEELILQSLKEMCGRQDFVEGLPGGLISNYKAMFGNGVFLIFNDTADNWFPIQLSDQAIELQFKTGWMQTLDEIANIEIGK